MSDAVTPEPEKTPAEQLPPEPEQRAPREFDGRIADLEPTAFEEGFTIHTMLGALFAAVFMMPGAFYLFLMLGGSIGPMAEWTTIILFVEVARRSFTVLKRQEIYLIYYLVGTISVGGGAFYPLIWNQYLRQSPAARSLGLIDKIPNWVAPPPGSAAYIERTFLHHDWLIPIVILVATSLLYKVQVLGMGYILFRFTSDLERLPFPLAQISAQGATALAEVSEEKESWRWPVFSTGTMMGLVYGVFYIGIPIITGAFLLKPISIIPIPYADFTLALENRFPTGRFGIATDFSVLMTGFVIPYPVVAGSFIAYMLNNFVVSPLLYKAGAAGVAAGGVNAFFPTWRKGMDLVQTEITTGYDVWISVAIGVVVAFAVIGLATTISALRASRREGKSDAHRTRGSLAPVPGRGDFPLLLALAMWLAGTLAMIGICHILVPHFPLWIIAGLMLLWAPIIAYVSTRLYGISGGGIRIPYLTTGAILASGYKGVDIWFAPIFIADYGYVAARFREVELTGTKMTSLIKAEIFAFLLLLVFSFIYWSFFWKLSPIPSAQYPYCQTVWPINAFQYLLWCTGNLEGGANFLQQALKWKLMAGTFGGAVVLYWLLSLFGVNALWFYGLLGGMTATAGGDTGTVSYWIPTLFLGAVLGRYYFAKRFGLETWHKYCVVLTAGYVCGIGLIGMFAVSLAMIFKAVRVLPY
jgi:hypothetical protein